MTGTGWDGDGFRDRVQQALDGFLDEQAARLAPLGADAERLVAEARQLREQLIAAGREEQAELVAAGQAEHERLLTETEVYRSAVERADELGEQSQAEAARLRGEVDEYVDSRLADFGGTLERMMRSVDKAREALRAS